MTTATPWALQAGYDPAHSYFSVGVLLAALGVQEAIATGKRRFDFLRGSEPYKYAFRGRGHRRIQPGDQQDGGQQAVSAARPPARPAWDCRGSSAAQRLTKPEWRAFPVR